jgi:hypothetical protein
MKIKTNLEKWPEAEDEQERRETEKERKKREGE